MNDAAFGNTMENVTKDRNIELVTTGKRRNQIVSEPIIIHQNTFQKIWWQWKWKRQK